MEENIFALRGQIVYTPAADSWRTIENGYLVWRGQDILGVYAALPPEYEGIPLTDYGNGLIIPGLVDLHVHAPQYAFRGLGMNLELLEWLNRYAFPEEEKYADLGYAGEMYGIFADALLHSATTRAVVYATLHAPAAALLMNKLADTGLGAMVGKVNMDRNAPDGLRESSAAESLAATERWLHDTLGRYPRVSPIITPRFIPSCSGALSRGLGELARKYKVPVQSHLSENLGEIEWVKELCPGSAGYADAYDRFGLLGGDVPTVMAHCVYPAGEEDLLCRRGVMIAHCPGSNANLASGIAPVRRLLRGGIRVGLGSDVAGGHSVSILRAMSDAVQASKLYFACVDRGDKPLSLTEAFYLGTMGGGQFFAPGRLVGGFEPGYAMDAVVIDDSGLRKGQRLTLEQRVERAVYLSADSDIEAKYVDGIKVL